MNKKINQARKTVLKSKYHKRASWFLYILTIICLIIFNVTLLISVKITSFSLVLFYSSIYTTVLLNYMCIFPQKYNKQALTSQQQKNLFDLHSFFAQLPVSKVQIMNYNLRKLFLLYLPNFILTFSMIFIVNFIEGKKIYDGVVGLHIVILLVTISLYYHINFFNEPKKNIFYEKILPIFISILFLLIAFSQIFFIGKEDADVLKYFNAFSVFGGVFGFVFISLLIAFLVVLHKYRVRRYEKNCRNQSSES